MEGRVALVTGAGSRGDGIGNGRAAAILMAREGARVGLIDNVREWVAETERMIVAEGGECLVVDCDVTDDASCAAAVKAVIERWGKLDVLINNVGVGGPPGTALDVDLTGWDEGLRTNLTSMMLMARHSIPEMMRAGGGAIVNMSSVAGLTGGHPNLLYSTTKGAIVNLTRSMAAHHGQGGIRVNAVAPGMVYTPMVASRGMPDELRESRRRRSLLQTEGTGWDVGNAVLFLASDEARWITGVTLPVDAGTTAGTGAIAAVPPS